MQKYTLNKAVFPDVTYAHLTTKDRVLYEVRRGTARQYVFGHATVADDRVLAAPVRSFCPRAGHSTEFMHHWKVYTPESNVRIDKQALAAELRQTVVSVAGSQLRVDSKAGDAVNVWQELQKLLHRTISFSPITQNNNAYAACNHVNWFYEAEFSEVLRLRRYRELETVDFMEGTMDSITICENCDWKGNGDLTKLFDGSHDELGYELWPWYKFGYIFGESRWLQETETLRLADTRKNIRNSNEVVDGEAQRLKMLESGVCENVRTPSYLLSRYTRYDRWELGYDFESEKTIGWIEHDKGQPVKESTDLSRSLEYFLVIEVGRRLPCLMCHSTCCRICVRAAVSATRWPRYGLCRSGACYEQDVHDTSNFENEPWWVESTCDMLRNFMDGKTHYNALRIG